VFYDTHTDCDLVAKPLCYNLNSVAVTLPALAYEIVATDVEITATAAGSSTVIIAVSSFETTLLNTADGHPQCVTKGTSADVVLCRGLKTIAVAATPAFYFKFAFTTNTVTTVGFTVKFINDGVDVPNRLFTYTAGSNNAKVGTSTEALFENVDIETSIGKGGVTHHKT